MISLIAALLAGILVYGIYRLQVKHIQLQETVDIVAASRFIATGEQLTADMLAMRSIPLASLEPGMLTDTAAAVGMEAAIPIGAGEAVVNWKVEAYRLMPKHDEATFQIPRSYVHSISSGIRAGDKVAVYRSGGEGGPALLFDELITVAGVKTSGNMEIDDPDKSHVLSMADGNEAAMYVARRNANGSIDTINLNLTGEQWLAIDELCAGGEVKLVIAFSPFSMNLQPE